MKKQINILSMLKFTTLAAYLFSQAVTATTAEQQTTQTTTLQEIQIIEEIKSGFNNLLADLGFPEVKYQAKKQLQHNSTERHATELVNAANQQLPEYKFKVVIAD